MKYFTLQELAHSDTAIANNIDNEIPKELIQNAKDLIENVLDKIRERYGKPVVLNCAYRSPKLNRLVGGTAYSDHLKARAADVKNNEQLQNLILEMIAKSEIDFDQLIVEKPNAKGIGAWLHISYRKNANRKQILIFKNGKYAPFNPAFI